MGDGKNRMAAKDTVFGALLIIFGIYVICASLGMKYFKIFMDGAGFFPLILGVCLTIFGVVLTFIGIKTGGIGQLKEVLTGSNIAAFLKEDTTVRVVILIGMMALYMFFLVDWIGFRISTPIFLMANFLYLGSFENKNKAVGLIMALLTSLAVTFIAYYAFKLGLGLTLP